MANEEKAYATGCALAGLLLLLVSVGLGIYTRNLIVAGTLHALSLDKLSTGGGTFPAESPCDGFSLSLQIAKRVISDSETQAVVVVLSHNSPQASCDVQVHLDAPEFAISPSEPNRRVTIISPPKVSIAWILNPQKIGTFTAAVTATPYQASTETETFGITVTNVFGLNPWQMQILTYIGSFLGPLLTAAWWYDRWKEYQQRKAEKSASQKKTVLISSKDTTSKSSRRTKSAKSTK